MALSARLTSSLRAQGVDDDDVQVRREDQEHINQFGRLNQRMHDLNDDLKAMASTLLGEEEAETLAEDEPSGQYHPSLHRRPRVEPRTQ